MGHAPDLVRWPCSVVVITQDSDADAKNSCNPGSSPGRAFSCSRGLSLARAHNVGHEGKLEVSALVTKIIQKYQ